MIGLHDCSRPLDSWGRAARAELPKASAWEQSFCPCDATGRRACFRNKLLWVRFPPWTLQIDVSERVVMSHPMQDMFKDDDGRIRFKPNNIVRTMLNLLESKGLGMNNLCMMEFPQEDWEQFFQIIGYSVSAYGGLSMISKKSGHKADKKAYKMETTSK